MTEGPYQDERTEELRKRLCRYPKSQRRNFPKNLRRPAPSRIRMEYMSIDGTMTMLLRVVAPKTHVTIDGF